MLDMDEAAFRSKESAMAMPMGASACKGSAPMMMNAERDRMISASYVKYAVGSTAITVKKKCAREGIRGGKKMRPVMEEE